MIENIDYTQFIYLFVLGSIFGSFLNVVIYRLPKGLSVIKPGSYCPNCQTEIKWYKNIPIFSYLFLKGKCSTCDKPISFLYPIVELLTGIIFVVFLYNSESILEFVVYIVIAMLFLCLVFIDFKDYLLPDVLLSIIFLVSLIYFGYEEGLNAWPRILFGLMTGTALWILRFASSLIYKKEAFGLGDVKLGALMGFLLGIPDALIAIFFGFVIAAFIFFFLIIFKKVSKDTCLPFGPYMVFGMISFLLYGEEIIQWYVKFFV